MKVNNIIPETFDELVSILDEKAQQVQLNGTGGECPYKFREFFVEVMTRTDDFDVKVCNTKAVKTFWYQVPDYLRENEIIFWRVRPEHYICDWPQVIRYADDGPDIDVHTSRRCYLDKGWKKYSIYARVFFPGERRIK